MALEVPEDELVEVVDEAARVMANVADRVRRGHVLDSSLQERCIAVATCATTTAVALEAIQRQSTIDTNGNGRRHPDEQRHPNTN